MTSFNLSRFKDCEHEYDTKVGGVRHGKVDVKQKCIKCGMDRRMEDAVKKLKQVDDERRRRNDCSEQKEPKELG